MSLIDMKHVYAGGMLRAAEYLEEAIARLFIGLLNGRLAVPGVSVRVKIGSPSVAREVLLDGRNYLDWLPYRTTKDRAKIYFRDGGPFVRLTDAQEQTLERIRMIRNAVAHGGDHALKVFENKIIGNQALPPAQLTPEGYLRGQHAQGQSRINHLLAQSAVAVRTLCT